MHCAVWIVLFLSALQQAVAFEKRNISLSLDNSLDMRSFGDRIPLALSPDGKLVAYTLNDPKRKTSLQDVPYNQFTITGVPRQQDAEAIWIASVSSGATRNLMGDAANSWSPVWSPDGRKLAFYSDRDGKAQLWVWDRDNNKLLRPTEAMVHPYWGFEIPRWAPDSRHVLVKLLSQETEGLSKSQSAQNATTMKSTDQPDVLVFYSPEQKNANSSPAKRAASPVAYLASVDIQTGSIQRLIEGKPVRGVWVSPNGRYVAATIEAGMAKFDLLVTLMADGRQKTVASAIPMEYGVNVSWSPDSQYLAFTTDESTDLEFGSGKAGDCYVVSVKEGLARPATTEAHASFSQSYRPPLWSVDGNSIYLIGEHQLWSIDLQKQTAKQITHQVSFDLNEILGPSESGRYASADPEHAILVRTRDPKTERGGFFRVELASGMMTRLREEPQSFGYADMGIYTQTATLDAKTVIYLAESVDRPPDLWITSDQFQHVRQLTHVNPQLEALETGKSELIEYSDASGNALHGALLLPAGYEPGKQYPLITWIYGGNSGSRYVYRYGFGADGIDNMQLFAEHGYAVLYPDTPQHVGTPMKDLVDTVVPAVKKVIAMGIADPKRLGVMGHSYGGYAVLALITQTDIFQAAVARATEGDLVSQYSYMRIPSGDSPMTAWAEDRQGLMGGTPWQFRNRYIENSPFFFLDHVSTPLLLIHGGRDMTVPSFLADQIFVGLRRLRKQVEYARYVKEDHAEAWWSYSDRRDAFERIMKFFDARLGDI